MASSRRGVVLVLLVGVAGGCGKPSTTVPPDFVDCQPRLSFIETSLGRVPQLMPAGAASHVTFGFRETCALDLGALAPTARVYRPDNSTRPLDVQVHREADTVRAELDFTPDEEGWWMVELSLDPGWARPQALVRAVANRASTVRSAVRVGGDVSRCFDVQRTPGGTTVCRTAEGYFQLREGIASGFLGTNALAVGDVAWATDGARVLRFVDSATGLRVAATFEGDLWLHAAERDVALVSVVGSSFEPRQFHLLRFDGTTALAAAATWWSSNVPFLVDGGVVAACPGPGCDAWVYGQYAQGVLVTDPGGVRARLVPLDGGNATPVDVAPGVLQSLSPLGAADVLPAVWAGGELRVLLRVPDAGPPRLEWLGPGLLGASTTEAVLRGAAADEVVLVPLSE